MNIYVASSWRNERQPDIVQALRDDGHTVYDFRNPRPGREGFAWSDIDVNWQDWSPEQYRENLSHRWAEEGFASDMEALRDCDAVVAVQPFGRSASLELGWACGAGKLSILLLDYGEPELMVKMVDHICCSMEEVLDFLAIAETRHALTGHYREQ